VIVGEGVAIRRMLVEPVGQPGTGFALTVEIAASNPLVGLAPDIDVQLNLKMTRDIGNSMAVSGNLVGDGFPDCELFLRDAAGDSFLVFAYRTPYAEIAGPMGYLPGHNFRPMGRFSKSVRMTSIGLING
jgi:hypothetical protein